MHKYSKEQLQFIRESAKGLGNIELTKRFNDYFLTSLSVEQIKSFKARHKISSGLTGRYEKGSIPINKGTKGLYNVGGNRTSYKKGDEPHNCSSIGTEVVDKDGYLKIKVSDDKNLPCRKNWKFKHRLIWEEINGAIPKGHAVMFADQDKRNFHIDNLILISHSERLILNKKGLVFQNAELTKTGITTAKLINTIYKRK